MWMRSLFTGTGGRFEVTGNERPGSDFMVDVIKSLGIEYCAANPGSSFRGSARIDYQLRRQQNPELITCCHEESSAAMAHGYAKIEGKPMMIMAHGTVGLQHASMAIYNAYADRVPMYIILGNILDADYRAAARNGCTACRTPPPWCAITLSGTILRSRSPHFAESAVRAYTIAMTPPYEPVVIVADGALQEEPIDGQDPRIPKLVVSAPPQGDSAAVPQPRRCWSMPRIR